MAKLPGFMKKEMGEKGKEAFHSAMKNRKRKEGEGKKGGAKDEEEDEEEEEDDEDEEKKEDAKELMGSISRKVKKAKQ
jgi:hypothetical protein